MKRPYSGPKRTNGEFGVPRPQNHLKRLLKQGKTSQHDNWPRYMDCPQVGPKSAFKLGKKRQKDKWYLFRAPTGGGGSNFIEIPRKGGPRSREGVCGELGNFGGGGVNIFFRGRNVLQDNQGTFFHDKGQKSAISGRRLHWIFGNFVHWIFSPFSRFYV